MPHPRKGRDFIARHGETVFNAARILQGDHAHTPLTRAGIEQAEQMGLALRQELGAQPALTLWASPTGRALQTLAIVAELLDLDWHGTRTDTRLVEIGVGDWSGRTYQDVIAEHGDVHHPGGILKPAPGGEDYPAIAARVSGWLADTDDDPGDRLVIMHGISSRVLRGVMTGQPANPAVGAPVAQGLPQGSVSLIAQGAESVLHAGNGYAPA